MSRLDRYLFAFGTFITIILAAGIIGSALQTGLARMSPAQASEVDRYVIQGEYPGGFNVFDTATGRFCSIPTGNTVGRYVTCTESPN